MKERKLETLLLGQPVSEQTRETVLRQFQRHDGAAAGGEEFLYQDGRPGDDGWSVAG